MKKLAALSLASLVFATALPVAAGGRDDRHGGHGGRDWNHQNRHERQDHRDHHRHQRHNHNAWIWGATGLALGGALFALETRRPAPVAPVIVAPVISQPATPPGQMWYYCDAYQAYYPHVQRCPDAWRAVPAW